MKSLIDRNCLSGASVLLPLVITLLATASSVLAQDEAASPTKNQLATNPASAPQSCLDCHNGKADAEGVLPPNLAIQNSIHKDLECVDCHEEFSLDSIDPASPAPHGDSAVSIAPGLCGGCHEEAIEDYTKHGRLDAESDPDIPRCWHCHGSHDILPSSDRQSHVHQINLPSTCRKCHTDVDLVKRHDILRDKPIKLYEGSVHGKATKKGLYVAANCNDCHAAKREDGTRTAHRILSPADPDSTIYHFNIPDTCGRCHKYVTQDYWEGVHGKYVKHGSTDSPVCTHCHGEHGIISSTNPLSPVSSARVAEETCAPCHESPVLAEKFGFPGGRLASYIDSYHGLKSKAGDVSVATCASCHGSHRILPSSDPTSSIHAANLQETCGECHPGISTELAQTRIHEAATGLRAGWPHFFTVLYYWLIGITIGLMLLHCLADWFRQIRNMRKKPFVLRLSVNETAQHWLLAISFIVLVISGFSLRFSETWWVQLLFGWGGGQGFLIRGLVHRIAAVFFVICCIWHLWYLCGRRGRRFFVDMLARPSDLVHIKQSSLYFLGLRKEKPKFDRFSYMEKCEYWALIWGGVIMTGTGILLSFDDYFAVTWGLPKGLLDVMLVIHYYEAWLATLAILVWHGYSTVFNPHVYPMNPAWLTGKMPRDMYEQEHPAAPRLKAYRHREPDEENYDEVDSELTRELVEAGDLE